MAYVEREILIGAPMDTVYNYAEAAENLAQWYVGIAGVQPDGVWPQVGGRIGIQYQVSGVNLDLTATVITYNPPFEFAFQMDGMVTGTSHWIYADADGNTHLTVGFDYDLPGGALGQIADKLVVEQMNIANGEESLANLKAICEGG
ncbi:MAG: SRPBCC family protein [Anaerolineae bacterium]|nr:SRPBCC family protein [Anaerolineae bacterium]